MEMVCSSCSNPSDDYLCSDCQFWDHFYSQPDPSSDEDSCIFCNQLKNRSAKQELKYDEGSGSGTNDGDDKSDQTSHQVSDELQTHPSGSDESWTFFYNLIHPGNGLNIKLGDCVEVISEKDSGEKEKDSEKKEKKDSEEKEKEDSGKKVIRCQFLFRDKGNIPWISGYEMIRTSEIAWMMRKGKKRRRIPVEEFPVSGDRVILDASECFIKLSSVEKILCALPLSDYEFGKPRGLKDSTNIFSCGFRFDPETGSSMHFVIPDFKTCFDPLVWERFVEPPGLDSVLIVSSNDESMSSPSILRKEGTPKKTSTDRRISFSSNLVQQFEYVEHDDE